MWVRGLKPMCSCVHLYKKQSHPMWVRGLKHKSLNVTAYVCASHPMWVRGLKLLYYTRAVILRPVAPYVGAWIETLAGDL